MHKGWNEIYIGLNVVDDTMTMGGRQDKAIELHVKIATDRHVMSYRWSQVNQSFSCSLIVPKGCKIIP